MALANGSGVAGAATGTGAAKHGFFANGAGTAAGATGTGDAKHGFFANGSGTAGAATTIEGTSRATVPNTAMNDQFVYVVDPTDLHAQHTTTDIWEWRQTAHLACVDGDSLDEDPYGGEVHDDINAAQAAPMTNTTGIDYVVGDGDQGPGTMYTDYYWRIWVIPETFIVSAARVGVDYPVLVWNAFPINQTNTAINDTGTGTGTVTYSESPPDGWNAIEIRTVNLQITDASPSPTNLTVDFVFTDDTGVLTFIAIRSSVLNSQPDIPVTEIYSWLTDVMTKFDGTEQRVGLREDPRLKVEFDLVTTSLETTRDLIERLELDSGATLIVPMYQYATFVSADTAQGATVIPCDTTRSNMREDEEVFIVQPDGDFQVSKISTSGLTDSQITVDAGLAFDAVANKTLVMPSFICYTKDSTGPDRYSVDYASRIRVECIAIEARDGFSRPGSTATITTFTPDGLPILDRRPLNNSLVPEKIKSDFRVIDYKVGSLRQRRSLEYADRFGRREYLIHRYREPLEFDFWRDFLDQINGRRNPFYLPSYRSDFDLVEQPPLGAGSITVSGNRYSRLYDGNPAFQQLALFTDAGTHYCSILQAIEDGDGNGNDILNFTPPLPVTPTTWVPINTVSLLYKARLKADEVVFRHEQLDTIVQIDIQTVESST